MSAIRRNWWVTDGSAALAIAGHAVWPAQPGVSLSVPFLARCQHDLRVNGVKFMEDAGMTRRLGALAAPPREYRVPADRGLGELHTSAAGFASTQLNRIGCQGDSAS